MRKVLAIMACVAIIAVAGIALQGCGKKNKGSPTVQAVFSYPTEDEYEYCEIQEDYVLIFEKGDTTVIVGVENPGTVTNAVIPAGVTKIWHNAFRGCENLVSVTIPEGVEYIGQSAFRNIAISGIVIPASVLEIGRQAFYNCWNLKTVTFNGTPTLGANIFIGTQVVEV